MTVSVWLIDTALISKVYSSPKILYLGNSTVKSFQKKN